MLSNIKEKIRNVTKTVKILQNEEQILSPHIGINLNAGSELLTIFQNNWEEIHKNTESNAQQAEKLYNDLKQIQKCIEKEGKNLECIVNILKSSSFVTSIKNLPQQINNIYNECEKVERSLLALEDIMNESEFNNLKATHSNNLQEYQNKQEVKLNKLKEQLDSKQEKVNEKKLLLHQNEMKERQKVFEEAFNHDIELYKALGEIPKIKLEKKHQSAILDEIPIDFDENELNKFLEDSL